MDNKVSNGVAAVIVTYNGDEVLIDNMQALLSQCEKVIVVDNNSTVDMSEAFAFAQKNGIDIIKNSENLGISGALNIGVRHVLNLGFRYYMTMDQDSVIHDGCVATLLDRLCSNKKIGSVYPNLRKIRKRFFKTATFLSPIRCISSGNLVKAEVFEKIGGYDEDLFIDAVDHDFNFRTILAGYKVVKVKNAFMKQKFGKVEIGRFGVRLPRTPSPFRFYYIARNYRYVRSSYFFRFPLSLLIIWGYTVYDYMRFAFFAKNWKAIKKEIKRGRKDYKAFAKMMKEKRKQQSLAKAQNSVAQQDSTQQPE